MRRNASGWICCLCRLHVLETIGGREVGVEVGGFCACIEKAWAYGSMAISQGRTRFGGSTYCGLEMVTFDGKKRDELDLLSMRTSYHEEKKSWCTILDRYTDDT